jgi:phage terminase large subunit
MVNDEPQNIVIPYTPRPLQRTLHDELRRFNVDVCHRRFGKTVFCVNEMIKRACMNKLVDPRYAYIAPLYNQAKDVAWEYVKKYTRPIPGVTANEAELRVDLPNNARIRLYGADNPDRLRGLYFDGVVLDEYAQMNPRLWAEVIRPALTDRMGWAIFIGTPMGRNQFSALYEDALYGFMQPDGTRADPDPDWSVHIFKASQTGIIPDNELKNARHSMTPDQYEREFECSFAAAIPGAYYAKDIQTAEAQKRISTVRWEPTLPVHTAWDLGIDDATAIWFFQTHFNEIRVIDYYESAGVGLSHYAAQLRSTDRADWVYGNHYLPHDAEVRELGTGTSRVETLRGLGIKVRVVPRQEIADGIQAVRNILPRCWFDAKRTAQGLEALRQYRADWDEKTNRPKPKPLHDWTSNGADAFRYLAQSVRDEKPAGMQPRSVHISFQDFNPLQ